MKWVQERMGEISQHVRIYFKEYCHKEKENIIAGEEVELSVSEPTCTC